MTAAILHDCLRSVTSGRDLAEDEAGALFDAVMAGQVPPLELAALLAALRTKGECAAEVAGAARALRRAAVAVPRPPGPVVDTCGTGGDGKATLNVSTAAAIVAAAGGAVVAKHGNRAASSRCGSADVLEALGIRIELDPADAAACLERVGIAFLFAPRFHPAMRHAAEARRALRVPTLFNLLGPLANPAAVRRQVLGVGDPRSFELLAEVAGRLEYERCVIVHGEEGLDEVSIAGPTRVAEWRDGELRTYRVAPGDFGLRSRPLGEVRGGDAAANAAAIRALLGGSARAGRGRDGRGADEPEAGAAFVALTAGCALHLAGVAETWQEGVEHALEVLASGEALGTLRRWAQAAGAADGTAQDAAAGDQALHAGRAR
ncbi:MAG TPA: anthranilate phosphoribosyltransferase [Gemmatimonadota bacterium]